MSVQVMLIVNECPAAKKMCTDLVQNHKLLFG